MFHMKVASEIQGGQFCITGGDSVGAVSGGSQFAIALALCFPFRLKHHSRLKSSFICLPLALASQLALSLPVNILWARVLLNAIVSGKGLPLSFLSFIRYLCRLISAQRYWIKPGDVCLIGDFAAGKSIQARNVLLSQEVQ